jgi:hypothetical protein
VALLHRRASWFTGFAASRKQGLWHDRMELLLHSLKFKMPFSLRPAGAVSLIVAAVGMQHLEDVR